MKPIVLIQRIFPAYRKPIFDAIHKKIDFVLLHSVNKSGIKQVFSKYSVRIKKLKYGRNDTHLFLFVFRYLVGNRPDIVIHELAAGILSLPFVLIGRKFLGYKLILWGHMYDHKTGFDPQHRIMDKYRLWLQNHADAIITYSIGEKKILEKNNVNSEKIFPALNTLDTDQYLPIRNQLETIGKENVKHQLGFTHDFNLVFIGRLYEDKLPHYLLEILKILNKTELSVAAHFVGTGEMENKLKLIASENGLNGCVFFHGEIYDEHRTGQLLFASDIMIMPGCVGLSVNHAFCFDCPVVTFEANENHFPAHGPEIEYIIDRKTGFIVENDNIEAMASTVEQYFNNPVLRAEMKVEIRNMIENTCPIGKLVGGFSEAIQFCLEK